MIFAYLLQFLRFFDVENLFFRLLQDTFRIWQFAAKVLGNFRPKLGNYMPKYTFFQFFGRNFCQIGNFHLGEIIISQMRVFGKYGIFIRPVDKIVHVPVSR